MTIHRVKKGMRRLLTGLVIGTAAFSATTTFATASTIEGILKSGELKFCFEAGYVPFEMTSKDGRFIGFDIDIAKHMAHSIDVKFVPVNTAWDGIIPALQTGKCDFIGGMTVTPKRNLKVSFADAYMQIGQTVLLSPTLVGKIHSYRDLNDAKYTVTTQMGTTGAQAAKKYLSKANVDLYDTSADAVLQVANGRADAFVYDLPYNAMYAAQHPKQVVHLDDAFTFEPLGWAVRQGDTEFVNFLNNYLKQIHGDGTYERIYTKWFQSDRWIKRVQ
ncbi:Putative ABC transporter arginine-binding protein 2 precursor [Vibrio spartinae]|uniref:ABC transporter arginine-binding protein 2 n=2 Tax=Vibrio spartinae TaxID=1918945 RepID=A0A1N6M748_9VIBR|nr:transporter substrate-binding domain-containing protein [Vibrio spartinae]QMV14006.1 Putative ABC transporter arginine-binding protein 2 precursor [Vibrio spartinae]SIO95273.1 Putative ABC transporter arginine-binding protein 2 precursor [Vibrio spartinae]